MSHGSSQHHDAPLLRFSGGRPQAAARRYVYAALATTLRNDIDAQAGYLFDDLDNEFDRRRALKAAHAVLRELLRKASP